MKSDDALFLLLLVYVIGRSGNPSNWTPGTVTDERWLPPGVYWWCAKAAEAETLLAWFRENAKTVRLAKMLGTNGDDCAVVLFEVIERTQWTLGGTPEEAPRGLDTTLEGLKGTSALGDFFRRMAEKTWDEIKRFDDAVQRWMQQHMPAPP